MHEASIAQSIIDTLQGRIDEGRLEGRIAKIFLRIGRLTSVVPDNLRFVFPALARGTAFEDAGLEIEEVPVRGSCRSCGARFEIAVPVFSCVECRSSEVRIESGRELLIDAVEVD